MPELDAPLLTVSRLACGYRNTPVLDDVDLDVAPGELVGVLGPNGAGKSTFIKTLMGVIPALSGSVRLGGQDITRYSSSRRFAAGLVWVPEGRRLFNELDVDTNLRVAQRAHGLGRADLVELFPVLERVGRRPAGSLSGGEQQMVALARALAAGPRLLLLDEPSLGLAPKIVDEIMHRIRSLRALDCAVVMVEQNVELALDVVDRVVLLEDGALHDLGAPEHVANDDLRRRFLGQR